MILMGTFWGCENAVDGGDYDDGNGIKPQSKPSSKPVANGITVEPGNVTLGKGASQKFVATVTGDSETLIWSVSGGKTGTTETTGGMIYWLEVDADETAKELIVKATLPDDSKVYGEAVVQILGNEGLAVQNGLAVRPQSVMLGAGDTQTFKAYLLGEDSKIGAEAADVSWSVNSASGSKVSDGTFTVASGETASTLIVTATREGMSGTAIVTVLGSESELVPVSDGVYVSPQIGSVKKGRTTEFKAYKSLNEEIKSGLVWTVFGGVSGSTTISNGSLTVAEDESAAHLTVRAKTADGRYGTAVVAVIDIGGLNTIVAIREYLNNADSGRKVDAPVPLPVNLNLSDTGGNGWKDLLAVIQEAGKFVSLDLSDCTMGGTTFDPDSTNSTGKNRIVSLTLPEVATSIKSSSAFKQFSNIRRVAGKHTDSIGSYAFEQCYSLTSVDFPAAKTINNRAFYQCTALTSVSLPSATSVGDNAFYQCTALTSASLPSAESIGASAFYGCTALAPVSITSVKSIGNQAFYGCKALRSAILLAATSIGDSAFLNCTGLEQVSFPVITKIDKYAFRNCGSLKSVTLPASLTSVGTNPFAICPNLTAITIDPANSSYKVENGMLLTIDGTKLISYPSASGAITLSSVINVNDSAFYGCTALISVGLPSATSIGIDAFFGCTALLSAELPLVLSVGNYAFYDCSSLSTVNLTVATSIGGYAFNSCSKLTSINLPAATIINNYAFQYCGALEKADLPKAASVGHSSFRSCSKLTSISLPAATSVDSYAFQSCGALEKADLPKAASIGGSAFKGCYNLTSVSLPVATNIGAATFQNCSKLTSASLPAVTNIDISTFSNCSNLTSVSLPEVTNIGDSTFSNCYNLVSLSLPASPPTLGKTVFDSTKNSSGTSTGLTIRLPSSGNVSAYTSAWKVQANTPEGDSLAYGYTHRQILITGP
ncbi:MAG: leucine-rich repeat protein [Spirochaetaceae bacterium]|nr:leucine-rich repeat protein [Spirochaetaceae bacterium]